MCWWVVIDLNWAKHLEFISAFNSLVYPKVLYLCNYFLNDPKVLCFHLACLKIFALDFKVLQSISNALIDPMSIGFPWKWPNLFFQPIAEWQCVIHKLRMSYNRAVNTWNPLMMLKHMACGVAFFKSCTALVMIKGESSLGNVSWSLVESYDNGGSQMMILWNACHSLATETGAVNEITLA